MYLNLEGNRIKSEGIMGVSAENLLEIEGVSSKIQRFLHNNTKLLEFNLNDN